jgi:hypothetical protein
VAKVFGEAGRNAAEESYRLTRRFLLVTLVGIAVLSLIEGLALSAAFPIRLLNWRTVVVIFVLFSGVSFLIYRWGVNK